MKKYFSICLAMLFMGSLRAQSWCPPGAEWYHTRYTMNGSSYVKINYTGTVVVNTFTCQQLNYQIGSRSGFTNQVTISNSLPTFYTYISNSVVYLRIDNTTNFDTLYHFNAVPGNQWLLPANKVTGITCTKSKLTVLDTGHRVVQGVNLRWLKVNISNGFPATDTIYERLGFKQHFFLAFDLCSGQHDYYYGGPLRCYSDNQILNYKLITDSCDHLQLYLNSIEENSILNSVKIYPNPTADKIFIDYDNLEAKTVKLLITNPLGQVIQIGESPLPTQEINIRTLEIGFYFLTVQSENRQKVFKILKE
jgi:hypothetical protein